VTVNNDGHNPFPDKMITNLFYVEEIDFGSAAASNYYQFRLNSVFDPDVTSTGHQPYGHDQLAGIYNYYRVIECTFKIVYSSASSDVPVLCVTCPLYGSDVYSSASQIRLLAETQNAMSSTAQYRSNVVTHSGRIPVWTISGMSKQEYMSNPNTSAALGTNNPTIPMTLNLGMVSSDSTTPSRMTASVQLVYKVEVYHPLDLSQS